MAQDQMLTSEEQEQLNSRSSFEHVSSDTNQRPLQYGRYIVTGMSCAACSSRIERVVGRIPGVSSVHVNLSSERAYVLYDPQFIKDEQVISSIKKAGYNAYADTEEQSQLREQSKRHAYESLWNRWFLSFIVMMSLMADMLVSMRLGYHLLPTWCGWAMATIVQLLLGVRFYRSAVQAIRGKTANMDVLVSIASSISYVQSTILAIQGVGMASFDGAAMVLVMVTFGKLLEQRAKLKVFDLMTNQSKEYQNVRAHKIHGDNFEETPTEMLLPGDDVYVFSSEVVPTDVVLLQGIAIVDESILTGESHPAEKQVGDVVYGGSRNLSSDWIGRVIRTTDDTLYSRMIQMVDEAQMERSASKWWIDRVTAIFVPVVMLISILTLMYQLWLGHGTSQAITDSIAVLVAACPCALGLATPTALAVGLHVGLKRGVCLQNEDRLGQLSRVDTVVFDKTGTLTTGKLQIVHVEARPGIQLERLLSLAATVEDGVDHPVARAIIAEAHKHNIQWEQAGEPEILSRGVIRYIHGHQVFVGPSPQTRKEPPKKAPDTKAQQDSFEQFRYVDVQSDGVWLGTIWFSDEIRSDASEVVRALQAQGMDVLMLTGDSWANAAHIANTLGIQTYQAELTAANKTQFIRELQHRGRVVAMVGDGINDAPALKTADVGIAFGAATPEALSSADVAMVNGHLRQILWSTRLAQAMLAKIRQNLIWAILYNSVSVPLAFFGLMNPMWAGIGMAFSSVIVMSNSLVLQNNARHEV